MNAILSRAHAGTAMSNEELLSVQLSVYRYAQDMELASKLIEKSASAVKQALQAQG